MAEVSTAAESVSRAWTDAAVTLGGNPVAIAAGAAELVRRYGDPSRHYHGLEHVAFVLDRVRELDAGSTQDDRATLQLAAAAHDVVYRGRPGEDERDSAAWAVEALSTAGVTAAHRVGDLVLATAEHRAGNDPLAAVLLDADLAILAAPPERYGEYVAAVRAEYAHLDDEQWRAGRAVVLRSLLDRERVYATERGSAWETTARRNMTAELTTLTGGPTAD